MSLKRVSDETLIYELINRGYMICKNMSPAKVNLPSDATKASVRVIHTGSGAKIYEDKYGRTVDIKLGPPIMGS